MEQLALTCFRCGGAQTEDTYSNVDTVKDTEDKMRCVKLFGTLNTQRTDCIAARRLSTDVMRSCAPWLQTGPRAVGSRYDPCLPCLPI